MLGAEEVVAAARRGSGAVQRRVGVDHAVVLDRPLLEACLPRHRVLARLAMEDLVEAAFSAAKLEWKEHLRIDEKLFRPAEVDHLLADPSRARKLITFAE